MSNKHRTQEVKRKTTHKELQSIAPSIQNQTKKRKIVNIIQVLDLEIVATLVVSGSGFISFNHKLVPGPLHL